MLRVFDQVQKFYIFDITKNVLENEQTSLIKSY